MTEGRTNRHFVCVQYYADEFGEIEAVRPLVGPCQSDNDAVCKLNIKDWRFRKTGPEYRLCVMKCKTHDVHFTLYPPGHVPYGRRPLVDLGLSGESIVEDRGPPNSEGYFQAAWDGEQGIAWPKESTEGSQMPRFETQKRHLTRSCILFSLFNPMNFEKVADAMKVAGLVLKQATESLKIQKGYRVMASCVCSLLRRITPTVQTFFGLATCGYYAGIWPKIQWWDEKAVRYRGIPFRILE